MAPLGSWAQLLQAQKFKKVRGDVLLGAFRIALSDTTSSTKRSEQLAGTPEATTLVVQNDLTTQYRTLAPPSSVPFVIFCQLQPHRAQVPLYKRKNNTLYATVGLYG